MKVSWDQVKVKITPGDVTQAMASGSPSIVAGSNKDTLSVGVVLLRPEQVDIVGRRIKEILEKAVQKI